MLDCIEACSELDTSAVSSDAGAQPLDERCPEPPFPCERLCWELDARGAAFGAASGDADLAALGEPAIRCALARADECRSERPADITEPPVTGAPEPPVDEPVTWTRLFLECAGLPTDLDLFE